MYKGYLLVLFSPYQKDDFSVSFPQLWSKAKLLFA